MTWVSKISLSNNINRCNWNKVCNLRKVSLLFNSYFPCFTFLPYVFTPYKFHRSKLLETLAYRIAVYCSWVITVIWKCSFRSKTNRISIKKLVNETVFVFEKYFKLDCFLKKIYATTPSTPTPNKATPSPRPVNFSLFFNIIFGNISNSKKNHFLRHTHPYPTPTKKN